MSMNKNRYIPNWLIGLTDILLVNGALFLAYFLRFLGSIPYINIQPFFSLMPVIGISTIIFFEGIGLYKKSWEGINKNIRSLAVALFLVFLTTNTFTFWMRGFTFPRTVLFLGLLLQILILWGWRNFAWYIENKLVTSSDIIIIGDDNGIEQLKVRLNAYNYLRNLNIKDYISIADLDKSFVRLKNADTIIVQSSLTESEKTKLMKITIAQKKTLLLMPNLYDIILNKANIKQINDLPFLEVTDLSPSSDFAILKRLIDLIASIACLIIVSPIMLLISIAIKLSSKGPVFYLQERIGQDDKPFMLYKFRSMIVGAEALTGPVLATDHDPRITTVGKYLRATRLDELPQLWNIFKGDMSLVGPRPERPAFIKQFEKELPLYHYRHIVKPGLTGLAQVEGKYTTSPEDKLTYDLLYIRNFSLIQDLKILMQTIPVIMNGDAASGVKEDAM